jgi:hypothetical protein
MKYLSVGNDAKTIKGQKKGYLTGILYMAPHTIAGGRSMCPFSTAGCRAVCLYTAGRGGFNSVQQARIRKTQAFMNNPISFVFDLIDDIQALVEKAKRDGMIPAVRLNGTTDIEWEKQGIMEKFPDLQFYDYTKWPASRRLKLPPNYHITYSFSEKSDANVQSIAWKFRGCNTAAVFQGGLPATFLGRTVIDGDLTDLRFTDPLGVIVGLKTKGKARGVVDAGTGFVQKGITK